MREIKFRGKRIDNGEWAYGDYYKKLIYDVDSRTEKMRHYIGWQVVGEEGNVWNEYEEIAPETLGQYTGRMARKRTKIYDGDTVEVNGRNFTVIFVDGGFVLENDRFRDELSDHFHYEMEVIGNIHDGVEE